MTNEQNDRDSDKIIHFPNLKERLFEKGMAYLEAQNFLEASTLLQQAIEMDPTDSPIATAYLIALYESGDYVKAKSLAENLLQEGIGDYYEILDIYLMVLIQLNNHEYVVSTLEALFEEKEVPSDRMEHFMTLLQLSKKVVANGGFTHTMDQDFESKMELDFLKGQDLHEQMLQLGSLADKNIHPYLDSLIVMLKDEDTHPFLKTIILNVLRENRIELAITVHKLGMEGQFVPIKLSPIQEMPLSIAVHAELKLQLADHNPVLLNQIVEIMNRHGFILYPFEVSPNAPLLWAAAYRGMGFELYGEDWNKKEVAESLNVEITELEKALTFLHKLEEISSPIV